jgi:hypothetical protein
MTFLHEFMLCHLQMSVPHKAKETSYSVIVSFLVTESIIPFCWLASFYIAIVVPDFLLPADLFVSCTEVRTLPSMQVRF